MSVKLAVCLLLGALPALAQPPQLPPRNLVVELRQVEDTQPGTLSTQPATALLQPQQVLVRNGEKASLRMGQSQPIRWVQAVAGDQAASQGGVAYGLVWIQSGQALAVQPRWPGGKQPASVQMDMQSASVAAPTGNAELPAQQRSQASSTVSAPLGQWVTIAATGGQAASHTYSSEAAVDVRRLLQIRVSAP